MSVALCLTSQGRDVSLHDVADHFATNGWKVEVTYYPVDKNDPDGKVEHAKFFQVGEGRDTMFEIQRMRTLDALRDSLDCYVNEGKEATVLTNGYFILNYGFELKRYSNDIRRVFASFDSGVANTRQASTNSPGSTSKESLETKVLKGNAGRQGFH
jgi:hypothetical protein